MSHAQETIAIIPARGGSKGVPRKNIRLLGGKPLIAWSIEQALESGVVDRVVVSTEDEEIADVALQWGAEVPFLRPKSLAGDTSIIGEAISYTVQQLLHNGLSIWASMILYPTHPFRSLNMFQTAKKALETGHRQFGTFFSVGKEDEYHVVRNGLAEPLFRNLEGLDRSTVAKSSGLLNAHRWAMYSGPRYMYEVTDGVHLIDLDSEEDFAIAEGVLKKGLYRFEEN